MAAEVPIPREAYEGSVGGWSDGRLGQAYDLIDAVMRDQPADHDGSRANLKELLGKVESVDILLGRPA
jgi:hypothetical protein